MRIAQRRRLLAALFHACNTKESPAMSWKDTVPFFPERILGNNI